MHVLARGGLDLGDPGLAQPVTLPEQEVNLLALELLGARTDQELEDFLGNWISSIGKAVGGVANAVANSGIGKAVSAVGRQIGKAVDTIDKFVPIKAIANLSPIGLAMNIGKGIGRIAHGENFFKVAGDFVKSGMKDIGKVAQLASTVASFVPGIGTGIGAMARRALMLRRGQAPARAR